MPRVQRQHPGHLSPLSPFSRHILRSVRPRRLSPREAAYLARSLPPKEIRAIKRDIDAEYQQLMKERERWHVPSFLDLL